MERCRKTFNITKSPTGRTKKQHKIVLYTEKGQLDLLLRVTQNTEVKTWLMSLHHISGCNHTITPNKPAVLILLQQILDYSLD